MELFDFEKFLSMFDLFMQLAYSAILEVIISAWN